MLKLISKINCERCENIKNYLTQRGIEFEVEMAENMGYEIWRDLILQETGKPGFPLLIKTTTNKTEYLNGSTEEIIEKINEWYPTLDGLNHSETAVSRGIKPDRINYEWGFWGQPPEPKEE